MQDSNPGSNAEKDDTRTRLIGADDREATIRIGTPAPAPTPAPTPSPSPSPGDNEPRRGKTWIYVVIAVAVIAVGAVVALLLLGNDDKSDSKPLSAVETNEVPGVNDADIGDFLNTAMGARYDKGADEAVAADSAAVEEVAAVDSVAAW